MGLSCEAIPEKSYAMISHGTTFHRPSGTFRHYSSLTKSALIALSVASASAEGFRNPPAGNFGLGRAGGRIAQVDDVSAVLHNPANLVDLKNPQISIEPGFVYISTDFTGAGATAQSDSPFKMLSAFFASMPLVEDKVAIGLGVTSPYGLSNEWKVQGAFADQSSPFTMRYQGAYFSELVTINMQPTVAVKLHDKLTFAAGLDVMYSQLKFRRFYPWAFALATPGLPDGIAATDGTGTALGANFGLSWRPTEGQRIAATFRTAIDMNYEGDFTISNIPAPIPGVTSQSTFTTGIKFPAILGLAYGFQVNDKVRLEVQGEWLQFSNFDTLPLNVGNNGVLFPTGTNIPEQWKDTFTVGIGGDWRFHENWVLRGSYQYYESPVPSTTISPSIPDANQNAITIGIGYQHGRHGFDAAFSEVLYSTRNISGNVVPAFNGRYETTVHLFSVGYRFAF